MNMQYKFFLFDLAGVLLNLDIEQDTYALNQVGLPTFDQCLARPEICGPALDYLNGLTTEAEFLPQIRPYCRPDASDEEILWSMNAVLADIPLTRLEMLKTLRQQGHKVYLLSNLNATDWCYTQGLIQKAGYRTEELFDATFISYQMRLAKPDPRIYEEVIKATGLTPADTLYLDDTASNIDMGQQLGFNTVLVPMNRLETVFTVNE